MTLMPDFENFQFNVARKQLETPNCGVTSISLPIEVSGDWTFEVSSQQMKVSLNEHTIRTISSHEKCLMKYVRAATQIKFMDKDDLSRQIRLLPGKIKFAFQATSLLF